MNKMKFVCIMGRSNSGKSTVERALEKVGFKRSISYTTRKPQIRDGVEEKNGEHYKFVTVAKFNELVDCGIMVERSEYNGDLYGTPRPYGARRYVAVVELNGYRKLKEEYGQQVIGVYLKCDEDTAIQRAVKRGDSDGTVKDRSKADEKMLADMEKEADIVIDSTQDLNKMIAEILKKLRAEELD